jgi:hypothetical protein
MNNPSTPIIERVPSGSTGSEVSLRSSASYRRQKSKKDLKEMGAQVGEFVLHARIEQDAPAKKENENKMSSLRRKAVWLLILTILSLALEHSLSELLFPRTHSTIAEVNRTLFSNVSCATSTQEVTDQQWRMLLFGLLSIVALPLWALGRRPLGLACVSCSRTLRPGRPLAAAPFLANGCLLAGSTPSTGPASTCGRLCMARFSSSCMSASSHSLRGMRLF